MVKMKHRKLVSNNFWRIFTYFFLLYKKKIENKKLCLRIWKWQELQVLLILLRQYPRVRFLPPPSCFVLPVFLRFVLKNAQCTSIAENSQFLCSVPATFTGCQCLQKSSQKSCFRIGRVAWSDAVQIKYKLRRGQVKMCKSRTKFWCF